MPPRTRKPAAPKGLVLPTPTSKTAAAVSGETPARRHLYRVDITARLGYPNAGSAYQQFSVPVFAVNMTDAISTAQQNINHVKLTDVCETRAVMILKNAW